MSIIYLSTQWMLASLGRILRGDAALCAEVLAWDRLALGMGSHRKREGRKGWVCEGHRGLTPLEPGGTTAWKSLSFLAILRWTQLTSWAEAMASESRLRDDTFLCSFLAVKPSAQFSEPPLGFGCQWPNSLMANQLVCRQALPRALPSEQR